MYEQRIEESILTASRVMVNILAESLLEEKAEQISVAQFRILDMVQNLTDKPSEIAGMLDVSPAAVSSLLEKLEEKHLLARHFSTADRRRVILELTREGRRIVERVNAARKKRLARVMKGMTAAERRGLEEALHAFSRSYRDMKDGKELTGRRTGSRSG
jgi:DNA-binding MarR family transcriptional regulator